MMRASRWLPAGIVAIALAGCAEGQLKFGGGGDDDEGAPVVVTGNIDDVSQPAAAETAVFAFSGLRVRAACAPRGAAACDTFSEVYESDDAEVVLLAVGTKDFTLSDVRNGDLTVLFMQDLDEDGAIDAGDPVAVLEDPDGELADVRAGLTVELTDVDLDYAPATFPLSLTGADARTIRKSQTP